MSTTHCLEGRGFLGEEKEKAVVLRVEDYLGETAVEKLFVFLVLGMSIRQWRAWVSC